MSPQRLFPDTKVGELLEARHRPSHLQLFRYSAATWNSHRIHYDKSYAAQEGYPDVLVQSNLHTAFFASLCAGFAGPCGQLRTLEVSVRHYAIPGDVLICRGQIVDRAPGDDLYGLVSLRLTEIRERDGLVCALGAASVALPLSRKTH